VSPAIDFNGDKTARYNTVAMILHWIIAAAIICNLAGGYWMAQTTGRDPKLATPLVRLVLNTHELVGLTVLGLALVRLGWRLGHRPPPLPAMPLPMAAAARISHVFFYFAMILIPLTGALFVGLAKTWIPARAFPDLPWPVDSIPHFAPHGAPHLRHLLAMFLDSHTWLAFATAGLLGLHVLAAVVHQVWLRDDVLTRMLPRRRKAPGGVSWEKTQW
jgi:cytochrome b561